MKTITIFLILLSFIAFSKQINAENHLNVSNEIKKPKNWITTNISQAVFAKNINNREPQDIIESSDNTLKKIFFFTNIRKLKGETITHRWLYKDRVMAEVKLYIGGSRWRTWSSKNIWHNWLGTWMVQVIKEDGEILLEKEFDYYKL